MAKRISAGPTRCLEEKPSSQSVRLGGRFISLVLVSEESGLDHGYLSRILAGQRQPSMSVAHRIAEALGIFTEDKQPDVTRLMRLIGER